MTNWLVADVGGTNTRVGLAGIGGLVDGSERSLANAEFGGFAEVLAAYLTAAGTPKITALCAGVAGPVEGRAAQLTNFKWHIDAAALARATGARDVHLINDLQAQGYALNDLAEGSVQPLFEGQPDGGARLVLGLGTGCNIAVVHQLGGQLFVPPSETGHSALPHADGRLGDLIAHLAKAHSHTPIEAALSGPGLARVHEFVTGARLPPAQVLKAPGNAETLALFAALLGRVAGNLSLAHMATGGLFLIGGAARAIAPHLATSAFRSEFEARGPYAHILRKIPVSLITDDAAALRGCARVLQQRLA